MTDDRPVLKLVGQDGNAFFILGLAQKAARKAEWPEEKIQQMMDEARSGDYDNLLRTMATYFQVK